MLNGGQEEPQGRVTIHTLGVRTVTAVVPDSRQGRRRSWINIERKHMRAVLLQAEPPFLTL